ncbi:hypothetical protein NL676_035505 [Syzygium grande]|nr:hypothetical protein NL676_035505 [Syzygium grande]
MAVAGVDGFFTAATHLLCFPLFRGRDFENVPVPLKASPPVQVLELLSVIRVPTAASIYFINQITNFGQHMLWSLSGAILWLVAIGVPAAESLRNVLDCQALLLSNALQSIVAIVIAVVNLTIMAIQVISTCDSIVVRTYCHMLLLWIDVPIELYPPRVFKIRSPHTTRFLRVFLHRIMGKLSGSKSSRHGVDTLSQNHCALPAARFLSCPSVIDYSIFVNFIVQKKQDIFYFTRAVEGNRWSTIDMKVSKS